MNSQTPWNLAKGLVWMRVVAHVTKKAERRMFIKQRVLRQVGLSWGLSIL